MCLNKFFVIKIRFFYIFKKISNFYLLSFHNTIILKICMRTSCANSLQRANSSFQTTQTSQRWFRRGWEGVGFIQGFMERLKTSKVWCGLAGRVSGKTRKGWHRWGDDEHFISSRRAKVMGAMSWRRWNSEFGWRNTKLGRGWRFWI